MSIWLYPTTFPPNGPIIMFGIDESGTNMFRMYWKGYEHRIQVVTVSPTRYYSTLQQPSTSPEVPANAWTHVVYTFETDTSVGTLYIDGMSTKSQTMERWGRVTRPYSHLGLAFSYNDHTQNTCFEG
eukprot:149838-Rhodomonas_salina.1